MEPVVPLRRVPLVTVDEDDTFAAFYAATYARSVGRLTLVAGSRGVAEDAVQEAFVRLLPTWSRVSRFEDPSAWVRRVAYNILLARQRAPGRASRLLERFSSREETKYHNAYLYLFGFDGAIAVTKT